MSDTPLPSDPQSESNPQPDPTPQSFTLHPRPSLLRFLTEHNPCYLLSAACMLASLLALTNSLSWTSIAKSQLLTLILTLNLYEAALLAIGLFLIRRRGLLRDGRILLVLQAFFLADFGFLNAEIATADVSTGIWLNALLLALAAVKMGVVLRVLNPSFTLLQFLFVMAQLAILFATPVALRWMDANRGIVNSRQFYVLWWVIGMLPAAYELLARIDRGRIVRLSPPAQAAPTTSYLALPYVSLLAHLGVLHWVYQVDYVGADAAPVLLGLTLVINRFTPIKGSRTLYVSWRQLKGPGPFNLGRTALPFLRAALPAAAVLVSLNDPFVFSTRVSYPRIALTPTNLALVGAFFVYVYCFLLPHARVVLLSGLLAATAYVFGPTAQQVAAAIQRSWDWLTSGVDRVTPKTPGDWGILGVLASFALLAAGVVLSLRKPPDGPASETVSKSDAGV